MRWFILTIDLGMKPLLKQGDRTDCQNLNLSWPVARFWGCHIVPLSWWTWKSCPVGNPSPNQTNKQKDADTPIGSFIDIYLELFFVPFHIFRETFETCPMVAYDDLEGKTIHFTGFYIHSISRPKKPSLTIYRFYLKIGVLPNLPYALISMIFELNFYRVGWWNINCQMETPLSHMQKTLSCIAIDVIILPPFLHISIQKIKYRWRWDPWI